MQVDQEDRNIQEVTFFGGVDSDTALKGIAKGDFLYALNILNNSSGEGNTGIVTTEKGNLEIVFELPDGVNKTIGTAEDHENNLFYLFNWNDQGHHGIYQFDGLKRIVNKVLLNLIDTADIDILKFDRDYLILHADVVRKNLLYWVDGLNNARKTNIAKLFDKTTTGYGTTILQSFIDAYKRTSDFAPTVVYSSDTTKPFNRLYGALRRFAVRFIYDDGEKSDWSDFSAVATPDKEPFTGIKTIPTNNNCLLITTETGDRTVVKIEIAMQRTSGEVNNEGILNWELITTLDKKKLNITDNSHYTYTFYNDSVYPVTLYEKVIRPFNALPLEPHCQSVAKGRIVYTGGKEGFETVLIDVSAAVSYSDLAISEGIENKLNEPVFTIEVIPNTDDFLSYGEKYTRLDGSFGSTGVTRMRARAFKVTIGKDVKDGNNFHYRLNNNDSDYQSAYKAKNTDTATTVANQLKSLLVSSGDIIRKTPQNGDYYIYAPNHDDGDGNMSFTFIALATYKGDYFNASAGVEPVPYDTLKDTGESKKNIKLGSTIKLGIEYEDFDGRKSQVYTVDAWIVNIASINDLINGYGKTKMQRPKITLEIKHKAPKWAKFFQIVRSPDLVYDDYIQILIQKAVDVQSTQTEEYQDLIVGSLATFNKIHPNSNLQYTFKPGDRIRLIKKTSDNTYYNFFETEILSYHPVLTEKINSSVVTNGSTIVIVDQALEDNVGRFILIDGSEREIVARAGSDRYELSAPIGANEDKTYLFYQLVDYRGVARIRKPAIEIADNTLVEIFKPAQGGIESLSKQFYAFQKKFRIINAGTDDAYHDGNERAQTASLSAIISIEEGTAYVRNRELPTTNSVPGAQVEVSDIEDNSFSDFYASLINDNGRPNVEDTGIGQVLFENRMWVSNNSIEDTKINGLNDFDNSDKEDYNDEFGATKRTVADGNNIYVFKYKRNCFVPLDSRISLDDSGTGLRVASPKFLNPMQYFARESTGVGNNPEAFCSHDTHKYIVSTVSGSIIRIGQNGEEPVSKTFLLNKEVRSVLRKAAKNKAKIHLGFNPRLGFLIIAIEGHPELIYLDGFTGWVTKKGVFNTGFTPQITTNPTHGTVVVDVNNQFVYTPNENYVGKDSFIYRVMTSAGYISRKVCLEAKPLENRQKAWRPRLEDAECEKEEGIETGWLEIITLEEYFLDDATLTGVTKPNVPGDPDYIAPLKDIEACPFEGTVYLNDPMSDTAFKDCGDGKTGTEVTYSIPEGKYKSIISKGKANAAAAADLAANKQKNADFFGKCSYDEVGNDYMHIYIPKNNCTLPGQVGVPYHYEVLADTYFGATKTIANAKAQWAIDNLAQGAANTNGTCIGALKYSIAMTDFFIPDCGYGKTGSPVQYTVPAGAYSATTQLEANQKAAAALIILGQAYANTHSDCESSIKWNVYHSKMFTKQCLPGEGTGGTVLYQVIAGVYSGTTQAEADQKAKDRIEEFGQTYANENGECIPATVYWNDEMSDTFQKSCGAFFEGTSHPYTIAADTHSASTKELANAAAAAALASLGQANADAVGTCVQVEWGNELRTRTLGRDDCGEGYTATLVTYTVPANRYTGPSQEAANLEADAEMDDLAQDWANDPDNGSECIAGTMYCSQPLAKDYQKTDCGEGLEGTWFKYTTSYCQFSAPTQEAADIEAENYLDTNGPIWANENPLGTCDVEAHYTCNKDWTFTIDSEMGVVRTVNVAATIGYVNFLLYAGGSSPVKAVVTIDGIERLNTGYLGNPGQQSALDAALTALSLPTEPIVPHTSLLTSILKSTAGTVVEIKFYAPVELETEIIFNVSCPFSSSFFGNDYMERLYQKQGCTGDSVGESILSFIEAGTYTALGKAEANQIALNELNRLGQEHANDVGECIEVTEPPYCPENVIVFQVCNSNAIIDDNFDVLLNGTKIGELDLNAHARIGSVFIGSLDTPVITDPDFECPLEGMQVFYFDPALLNGGPNIVDMINTQDNGWANFGTIGVRNYRLVDNELVEPCVIANLNYSFGAGLDNNMNFMYTACCGDDPIVYNDRWLPEGPSCITT